MYFSTEVISPFLSGAQANRERRACLWNARCCAFLLPPPAYGGPSHSLTPPHTHPHPPSPPAHATYPNLTPLHPCPTLPHPSPYCAPSTPSHPYSPPTHPLWPCRASTTVRPTLARWTSGCAARRRPCRAVTASSTSPSRPTSSPPWRAQRPRLPAAGVPRAGAGAQACACAAPSSAAFSQPILVLGMAAVCCSPAACHSGQGILPVIPAPPPPPNCSAPAVRLQARVDAHDCGEAVWA